MKGIGLLKSVDARQKVFFPINEIHLVEDKYDRNLDLFEPFQDISLPFTPFSVASTT